MLFYGLLLLVSRMTKVTGVCHPPAYLQILKELVPKTETILLEAQDHGQHHRGDT